MTGPCSETGPCIDTSLCIVTGSCIVTGPPCMHCIGAICIVHAYCKYSHYNSCTVYTDVHCTLYSDRVYTVNGPFIVTDLCVVFFKVTVSRTVTDLCIVTDPCVQ